MNALVGLSGLLVALVMGLALLAAVLSAGAAA
jgi:hypothetical protein